MLSLWDLRAKDPAANPVGLRGHDGGVRAVAISPDSRWVVTGSEDKTARLWDLRAKDPVANPVVLGGTRTRSLRWRSAPIAAGLSPEAWTRRRGSGVTLYEIRRLASVALRGSLFFYYNF